MTTESPVQAAYAARDLSALISLMDADQQEAFKLLLLRDAAPRLIAIADAYVLEHFGEALQAIQRWLDAPTEDNYRQVAAHKRAPDQERLLGTPRITEALRLINAVVMSPLDTPRLITLTYIVADPMGNLPEGGLMEYLEQHSNSVDEQKQFFIARLQAIEQARDQWFLDSAFALLNSNTPEPPSIPYDYSEPSELEP